MRFRLALLVFVWAGSAVADEFSQCLVDLQNKARLEAVPDWIVSDVVPAMEQQTRVLELDRQQPEFVQSFGAYLGARLTDSRIEKGREMLAQYGEFLDGLTRLYGVPSQYLVAFWGLETNFGSYLGTMPTLDSLATLACDPRRSTFFTEEFLNALKLMDREGLQPSDMRGSWAGAVGHTQFMPSSYMRYAVDGDGNGQIDLWRSERDALASGAHFLSELGWVPELRWGREVKLPAGFDFSLAGLNKAQPLSQWAMAGVTQSDGSDLPQLELDAALLVPAGFDGPAFLAYDNFKVIMRWNRSESYALSVGLLADAIAGGIGLNQPVPQQEALRITDIRLVQEALAEEGFDPGPVDGIWGPATRTAMSDYEKTNGAVADGYPDAAILQSLLGGQR